MDSLVCQKALAGELGRFVSEKTRAIREAGEANTFSIYLEKIEEERKGSSNVQTLARDRRETKVIKAKEHTWNPLRHRFPV